MNQDASDLSNLDTSVSKKIIPILLGPILFIIMQLIPPPAGMTPEAVKVAAVALWMIAWWLTEAVPIAVTALLPLILLPFTGFSTIAQAASGYSNHLIFLFVGGFMIALAMERWNVHKRIAWAILASLGTSPRRMLLGFMVSTATISMWISNTATTMMMLPIATAVISQLPTLLESSMPASEIQRESKHIGKALMIGIAYAASIGGIGTIIGTPPNAVLAGAMKELFKIDLGFAEWMMVGVPLVIVGIFLAWMLLRVSYKLSGTNIPGAEDIISSKRKELGKISYNERVVLIVFCITAILWITRKWILSPILPKVNDSVIALAGAVALFLIPVAKADRKTHGRFLMDWPTVKNLPWGVVLLFGGGFSLAGSFKSSGLSNWIGGMLEGLAGSPEVLVIAAIVLLVTFLTEITSNTASTTLLMPIMAALATALNAEPILIMGVAAIAASCAFMFPVATPPNAIVFGTGYLEIKDMARIGIIMNIGSVILITILGMTLFPAFLF